MPAPARRRAPLPALAPLVLALVLAPGAAAAGPEVSAAAGTTFGVTGQPGSGGATACGALLWPVAGPFSFGVGAFADDLGTGLATLRDPNTGGELGTVASTHRWSFGGDWRAELALRETRRLRLLWNAGFGYGRQERDQRGVVSDAVSGVVGSTGLTALYRAPRGHSMGLALAIRRAFVSKDADPGRSTSWATAALEWRWKGIEAQ